MEVAGLCQVCQTPGTLETCRLCGIQAHLRCLESGRHTHGGPGPGTGRPHGVEG